MTDHIAATTDAAAYDRASGSGLVAMTDHIAANSGGGHGTPT
jgi:hypothetical protein